MADIDIERKRKSPLPWVLGLLALALIAFLLMQSCGGDDEPDETYPDTVAAPAVAPGDTTMYGAPPGAVGVDTFAAPGADTVAP